MPSLYITEFALSGRDANAVPVNVAALPAIQTQVVTISGASAASAALDPRTTLIRLHADANFSFVSGAAPVATVSNTRVASGGAEYFAVPSGSGLKIAAIVNG